MLVITKATYGSVPHKALVDVTAIVAKAVSGDTCALHVNPETMGSDPCVGRGKRLYVDYTLNGKAGTASAGERRTLRIG